MMVPPRVLHVSKERIAPYFGIAYLLDNSVEVREDLPNGVQRFVLDHELYHLRDINFNSVLGRELRANVHSAIRHPIGFLQTFAMSFTPSRLKLYHRRIKTNF